MLKKAALSLSLTLLASCIRILQLKILIKIRKLVKFPQSSQFASSVAKALDLIVSNKILSFTLFSPKECSILCRRFDCAPFYVCK